MEPVIKQLDDWQSKSASDIFAYFQESVSVPVTETYTVAKLIDRLGEVNARIVVGTIQRAAAVDPLMAPTLNALSVEPGIQLYSESRQAGIEQLAAAATAFGSQWPDGLLEAVKALGVANKTRWAAAQGDAPLPSVEDIQAQLDTIANRVFDQKQVLLSVSSGEQTTVSLVITPMSADGTLDSDNAQRLVLSNGVLVGTPTEQQATAVAALVSLIDSLKG